MITFGLHTYKAEINAMPCPPDEFQILITQRDQIAGEIRAPVFRNYDTFEVPDKLRGTIRLVYKRFKDNLKPIPVHDLLISKFQDNIKGQNANGRIQQSHRRRESFPRR